MNTPLLVSIQVGLPQSYGREGADDPMDRPWETGFFKQAVDGSRWLGRTNLAGDGQADLVNHGGEDKAVLCYAASHYPGWRAELDRPDLPHGAFGENFTIEGLTEETVYVGDTYRLGEAIVQVSQPRQPCWKLAWRWRLKELTALVERSGPDRLVHPCPRGRRRRAGAAADAAGAPVPGVDRCAGDAGDAGAAPRPEAAGALAGCEALAASWRDRLAEAAAGR